MLPIRVVARAIASVALLTGCSLFPSLDDLSSGGDGGATDGTTSFDSRADAVTNDAAPNPDGSTCTCTNLVSAYRFADKNVLGHDWLGNNDMTSLYGAPKQTSVTPPNHTGNSIQLDGTSSVCIENAFTFDSTADHTLCWWSQPTALSDSTNQFAQACGYDTWTSNSGVDYLWRINNCNSGTAANLQVQKVYALGQWTQICQTYEHTPMKRTVVVNGDTNNKVSVVDKVPIVMSTSSPWCIGSYSGSGGFWTGLIYEPLWFNRVLTDQEIQQVYTRGCCLP
jgi:Concanavalin A-like lectin/glucanases superfamily